MKNSKFLKLASFTLASLVLARCFCATPVYARSSVRSSAQSIFTSIPKVGVRAALGILGVGALAGVLFHFGGKENPAKKRLQKRRPDVSAGDLLYDYKPRLEISRCPILDYGDESLDSDSDVDSEIDEPYSDYDYDYEQDGNNGEPSLWDVLSQHRDYPVPEDPKNKPKDDLFRDVDNALMRFV